MIKKRTVFTIDGDITGRVFDCREAAEGAIIARHDGAKREFMKRSNEIVSKLYQFATEEVPTIGTSDDLYELESQVRALAASIKVLAEARRLLLGTEKQRKKRGNQS